MDLGTNKEMDQIRTVIAKDRMQAWIELPGKVLPDFSPPNGLEIVDALTEKGIEISDAVRERINEYVQIVADGSQSDGDDGPPEIPERFLIAEAQVAVDANNGEFVWNEEFEKQARDWQGGAAINYYTANAILTIEANTPVGQIKPPTESVVGKDVLGGDIPPRRKHGLPLKLGHGLRMAEDDSGQVVTEVPGRLEYEGNTICMKEVLTIPGDVDFKSGNIDSVIDVHIGGSIKPNFIVKTTGSLTVGGAVDAGEVDVGGDIQVRGGIFGQESGCRVKAGGSITASICDSSELEAGGDVCITKEIINGNVRTTGQLRIEHGSIIGGEIYARSGAKIKHAGSEVGVPTRIAVGVDGAVLHRTRKMEKQIQKHLEQAEQIRSRVQPLLINMKRLTPTQREQATELMAKTEEIGIVAEDLTAERERMLAETTPDGKVGIEIAGTVYQGVVLVFGLRETTLKNAFKGPMKVEERQVKGVKEITIVNSLTASEIPLPSAAVDVERFKEPEQESGESDGVE